MGKAPYTTCWSKQKEDTDMSENRMSETVHRMVDIGRNRRNARLDEKEIVLTKNTMVSFGMCWQCYGRQEIPLPEHIDQNNREELVKYIQSVLNQVPIPCDGEVVDYSDELDEESEIYCYSYEEKANYMEQESGRLRVVWENLNEGICGDYTGEPDDVNLLRFTVYIKRGDQYEEVDDASYCTNIPADTEPEILLKGLQLLLKEYDVLQRDPYVSVKKIGERLSHMSPEDFKVITPDMIRTGIEQGIVKFVQDPNMEIGTVCRIGENWFYSSGESGEEQSPEEYVRNTGIDDLVSEVYETLDSFRKDGPELRDEYFYYYDYLRENLKGTNPAHEN